MTHIRTLGGFEGAPLTSWYQCLDEGGCGEIQHRTGSPDSIAGPLNKESDNGQAPDLVKESGIESH
jgi:hypothetical protein